MLRRCTKPSSDNYRYYGAIGVNVCSQWLGEDGFKNFLADLGPRPPNTSLGRYLDLGDYEPGNCCWMKRLEQGAERQGNTAYRRLHLYHERKRAA